MVVAMNRGGRGRGSEAQLTVRPTLPVLFFVSDGGTREELSPGDGYECEMWRPKWWRLKPKGFPIYPFGVWWLCHCLRIFGNRDYGVFIVRHNNEVMHRSVVFPRFLRFPFMQAEDLQIGDTWTDDRYRGRGIASFAIQRIVGSWDGCPGRRFWYIVERDNLPSVRAATRAGLIMVGEGCRMDRWGFDLLGKYVLVCDSRRATAGLASDCRCSEQPGAPNL